MDFLDSVEIIYPRELVAQDGALEFVGDAGTLLLRGFEDEVLQLYDISDANAPIKITGFEMSRENGVTSLQFHNALAARRYLALSADGFKQPLELGPRRANDLRATEAGADYVVIAPREFFDALKPLVEHRISRGLRAKLVDVEQVYDAFSDSVPDPHALREFVNFAREQWQKPEPRFVLLVGKASYDYRDYLRGENKNLVPTFLSPTPHLGEAAHDDWFVATSDSDPHPTLALGRIPAETPEDVRTAVEKIIAYETASAADDWRQRALFVADDKDSLFDESSDALAQALAPTMRAEKIYLSARGGDIVATRVEIIRQWNSGALLLTYIGHGSIDTWAEGPLFTAEHVRQIDNGSRLPILLTPTCLDGFFYHPQKDSLVEQLLFKRDGGIVAALAPTGLSLLQAQDVLMKALFQELFAQPTPTLGEAIQRAKRNLDANLAETREVLDTFELLGDPALEWRSAR